MAIDDLATWLAAAVLLDLVLGGAAAASVGRAIARSWRSFSVAAACMIPLAAAIGFLHYAIFGLSPIPLYDIGDAFASLRGAPVASLARLAQDLAYWAALSALLTGFSFLGYRFTRRTQMTERYGWLFERSGLWSWRARPPA
jgi:hypothetical protein